MTCDDFLKKTFFSEVVNLSNNVTFSIFTAALSSCVYKSKVSWCTSFKE